METQTASTESLIPYERNNRQHSSQQVDRIANSIAEFGFNQPIVVDENNIVLVGHGRLEAAKKLGLPEVPIVRKAGLTETQKKAYRILDNKLQNDSTWDAESLNLELAALEDADFDLAAWGLDEFDDILSGDERKEDGTQYSTKIEAPIYQITGERPQITQLFDDTTTAARIAEIEKHDLPEEISRFLKLAASRHTVFNFRAIAEFYAHADSVVQSLFENSALIIIDYNKAIEKGFVHLTERLIELSKDEAEL